MRIKINFKTIRTQAGFTLLELMIVIAILSLISAAVIAVVNPADQIKKANDTKRKSDLGQIGKALEQYYDDNGRYPASNAAYQIVGLDTNPLAWGVSWPPYMELLPQDPSGSKYYSYYSDEIGQTYYLYASLDRGSVDKDACGGNQACPSAQNISPVPTCGNVCNFAVTSPNTSP